MTAAAFTEIQRRVGIGVKSNPLDRSGIAQVLEGALWLLPGQSDQMSIPALTV